MVNVAQGDYCSWHVVCALSKWDLYIRKNYQVFINDFTVEISLAVCSHFLIRLFTCESSPLNY